MAKMGFGTNYNDLMQVGHLQSLPLSTCLCGYNKLTMRPSLHRFPY